MIARLALFVSLVGCGPKAVVVGTPYEGPPRAIGLAPTVVLADVPGAVASDPFLENLYVGHIVFSGGFEVVQADGGLQNRSVDIETILQEPYRATVTALVDEWMALALDHSGESWTRLSPLAEGVVSPPERRAVRGGYDLQGHDNQNLPIVTLRPSALATVPEVPAGIDAILVPTVVYYYSHNAGWFQGQTWGTDAGARMRVLWSLHDATTGQVLAFGDHEARATEHGLSSPNSGEQESLMIEVEERLAKSLRKARVP